MRVKCLACEGRGTFPSVPPERIGARICVYCAGWGWTTRAAPEGPAPTEETLTPIEHSGHPRSGAATPDGGTRDSKGIA